MGITTVDSYRGAQIFEALGLAAEVVDAASPARRRWSAASAGTTWPTTCSRRHADAFPTDGDVRRPGVARLLPGAQGRRVPRQRQGGRAGAQRPHPGAGDPARAVADPLADAGRAPTWPPPTCCSGPSPASPTSRTRPSPGSSTSGRRPSCTTCSSSCRARRSRSPLDEVEPAPRDRPALLDRRHVARLAVEGGPREPGPRHEPDRRPVQLRRGRRGPGPLPHPRPRPRRRQLAHQAGRLGPLRRDARVPGLRRRDPDQDGPGLQAGRGRPAARPQGVGARSPGCATPSPASG